MLYDLTNTQFIKMLKNMSGIFDKAMQHAEAKKFDVEVLLNSRLAVDQFPLTRQVQIFCDTAKKCAGSLVGKEPPVHPDDEKNLPQLRARIDSVIKYLESFSEKDYTEAKTRHVTTPRWNGEWMTGYEYAMQHAVPNFYFHITTTYAILRHNGVDVGKKDYLGKMPMKK